MAQIYQPLEIEDQPGRWRVTTRSDESSQPPQGLCSCASGHSSPARARECPEAKATMDAVFPDPPIVNVSAAVERLRKKPPDVWGALKHLGAEA